MKLQVHTGLVDPDYYGPISVTVMNTGHEDFSIKRGEAICQLIVQTENDVVLFESLVPFSPTNANKGERGYRGLGSSTRRVQLEQLANSLAESEKSAISDQVDDAPQDGNDVSESDVPETQELVVD